MCENYNDPECDYPFGRYIFEGIADSKIARRIDKSVLTIDEVKKLIQEKSIILRSILIDPSDGHELWNIDKTNIKNQKDIPFPKLPCLDLFDIQKNDYLFYNKLYPSVFTDFLQNIKFDTINKDIQNAAKNIREIGNELIEKDTEKLNKLASRIEQTKQAINEVEKDNQEEIKQ